MKIDEGWKNPDVPAELIKVLETLPDIPEPEKKFSYVLLVPFVLPLLAFIFWLID